MSKVTRVGAGWLALLSVSVSMAPAVVRGAPVVKIAPGEYGCGNPGHFEEDNLTLTVSEGAKVLLTEHFCSSYGKATASVEKDALGASFVLLLFGRGRGTNARSEFLSVYRLHPALAEFNAHEQLTIPISGPASMHGEWRYEYRVSRPLGGGLRFKLTLSPLKFDEDKQFSPPETTRTIEVR